MSAAPPCKLVLLISGRGSNMTALIRACQAGAIAARPTMVISDRAEAAGLASARNWACRRSAWRAPADGKSFDERAWPRRWPGAA